MLILFRTSNNFKYKGKVRREYRATQNNTWKRVPKIRFSSQIETHWKTYYRQNLLSNQDRVKNEVSSIAERLELYSGWNCSKEDTRYYLLERNDVS